MNILINRDLEVRLSEDSSQYKQFWKQICKFGEYVNPNGNGKMILDRGLARIKARKNQIFYFDLYKPEALIRNNNITSSNLKLLIPDSTSKMLTIQNGFNLEFKAEGVKLVSNIISAFNNSKIDIGDNLKETLIAILPDYLVLTIFTILTLLALILIAIYLTVGFVYYQHMHNKSSPLMKEKKRGKYDDKRKRRKKYYKKRR